MSRHEVIGTSENKQDQPATEESKVQILTLVSESIKYNPLNSETYADDQHVSDDDEDEESVSPKELESIRNTYNFNVGENKRIDITLVNAPGNIMAEIEINETNPESGVTLITHYTILNSLNVLEIGKELRLIGPSSDKTGSQYEDGELQDYEVIDTINESEAQELIDLIQDEIKSKQGQSLSFSPKHTWMRHWFTHR